jgi:hypothetical protein
MHFVRPLFYSKSEYRQPPGEALAPSSSKGRFGTLSVLSYGDYDRRTVSRGIVGGQFLDREVSVLGVQLLWCSEMPKWFESGLTNDRLDPHLDFESGVCLDPHPNSSEGRT